MNEYDNVYSTGGVRCRIDWLIPAFFSTSRQLCMPLAAPTVRLPRQNLDEEHDAKASTQSRVDRIHTVKTGILPTTAPRLLKGPQPSGYIFNCAARAAMAASIGTRASPVPALSPNGLRRPSR